MNWKDYEIYIHKHFEKQFPDCLIQYNVKRQGQISKTNRQIDILIEGKIAGFEISIIVDCKYFSKKVDVKVVESFLSFLADLKASKGVIITNKGYSEAAYNRAIYDTQDIELRIIDFKDLDKFQNFGAVVWSGKYCSYVPAPPGWVMDAKVFDGAVAAIVPAGLSSKTAFKSEGFIYVSYSHKDKNFQDLKSLIDSQEKRLKETYPKSKLDYKDLKIREERVVLRCAEISENYEGPEYTTFIDFKEYVLFLVLLAPWNKEESYLKKLIWTTEKLVAGTCISNIEGKPISVHKLKNKL